MLPNHDYLYFFCWIPIAFYLVWSASGKHWSSNALLMVAGIYGLAGLFFFLAGSAQLYRAFILPFGLLPIWVSTIFFKRSYEIFKKHCQSLQSVKCWASFLVGPAFLIAISGIYNQPWELVYHLPNVSGATLKNADLKGLNFNLVKFENSDLSGTNFSGTEFTVVSFNNVNLDDTNFYGTSADGLKISDSSLRNSSFESSYLYQSDIRNSYLVNSQFALTSGGRFFLIDNKICGANFDPMTLSVYQWDGSFFDDSTKFPDGKTPDNVLKVGACD